MNQQASRVAKLIAKIGMRKLILWGLAAIFPAALPILLGFVVIAVIANLAGTFFFGSFTGVHLGAHQKKYNKENASIKKTYTKVADEWKKGLNSTQQSIVNSYQLYMPASVLLTMGKFVNNYKTKNQQAQAQAFYKLLKPKYTWVKGQGKTITKRWETRHTKHGTEHYIQTTVTTFVVWELRKADIWDGTFKSTWGTKTIGGFTNGVGTKTIEPYMESETMTYNHSDFYKAAKKYKYPKSQVNPLWYDSIYSMQYADYKAGNKYAMLKDPLVMQWGPMFGMTGPISPVGSTGTPNSIANKAQVTNWVKQALSLDTSYGIRSSWKSAIMDIISHEDASGNPYAVNPQAVNYTSTGEPEHAKGLMQMMPSTFQAFELAGHDNIFNPVDNIASALRYIQFKYHTPTAIQGIGNSSPYIGY